MTPIVSDREDDPQKAFLRLTRSIFDQLVSSLQDPTKFTTGIYCEQELYRLFADILIETKGNMKEWIEEWSNMKTHPEELPPEWLTEILTACFEHCILPSSLVAPAIPEFPNVEQDEGQDDEDEDERMWKHRERDLMAFLDRYFALLDHDRVLFFCNAHRLSLCISFFLHTEQILLHKTAAITPATPSTTAAQHLVQIWQELDDLLQPRFGVQEVRSLAFFQKLIRPLI